MDTSKILILKLNTRVFLTIIVCSQPSTSTSFASNIFTFDSNKINQSLYPNIQNKKSKRTFSNIVSDTNNGDSRPSHISRNPSENSNQPKQRRLYVFDSTDPNAESRPFNPDSVHEFKTAGKQQVNKGHHKSKDWLKSIGTKVSGEFKVAEWLCTIYIGRIRMDMDTPNISSLLSSMNISSSSLKQLETITKNSNPSRLILVTSIKILFIKKSYGQEGLK